MKRDGIERRTFLGALGCAACGCLCGNEACAAADIEGACVDAICGIYCGACPALMASREAKTPADIQCLGCRSTKKMPGYAPQCEVRKCANARALQSCGLCKDYPCGKIKDMFNETPKYGLREKYLNAVRDKGLPAWLAEMKTRWTCKKCGTPFGYGMTACKKCGEKVWSDAEEFAEFKKAKT